MSIQEDLMRSKDWIESALKKGGETHDFKDIVDGVMKGDFQLWTVSYTHLTLPTTPNV